MYCGQSRKELGKLSEGGIVQGEGRWSKSKTRKERAGNLPDRMTQCRRRQGIGLNVERGKDQTKLQGLDENHNTHTEKRQLTEWIAGGEGT